MPHSIGPSGENRKSKLLDRWEQTVRSVLSARLADATVIERFIAEVQGNPATRYMSRGQLTAFAAAR